MPVPAVIIVLAISMLAGAWVVKSPCLRASPGAAGQPVLDWSGGLPWRQMCYSDVIALYGAEHLNQPGAFPYKTSWIDSPGTPAAQTHYTEYPVLTGLFMWVSAKAALEYGTLAHAGVLPVRLPEAVNFDFAAWWLAVAWLAVVWAVMRIAGRRAWDALLVALSPLVLAQAFTNFDALAVAFATTGLLAWSRRRPVLAGVLLGLGTATKLYPVFLLIPLLALCWRAGKSRAAVRLTAAAVVSWAVVNDPIATLFPTGWAWFFRFSEQRGPGLESLYNIVSYFTHWGGFDGSLPPNHPPDLLNLFSGLVFVGCCVVVVVIALGAPRRPRVAQLCLLVVVSFLLTNKVYSPQYSLWLVPLAVLAIPRWRVLLVWMTIDALVWIPTMLFQLGPNSGGISFGYFVDAVMARDLALLIVCGLVVWEIFRPARDVVRRNGDDDPCGGVLDRAEDRVTLRRPRLALGLAGTRLLSRGPAVTAASRLRNTPPGESVSRILR